MENKLLIALANAIDLLNEETGDSQYFIAVSLLGVPDGILDKLILYWTERKEENE